jgi:hypothetical protein
MADFKAQTAPLLARLDAAPADQTILVARAGR